MANDAAPLIAAVSDFLGADDPVMRRLLHGRGGCFPGLENVTVDGFNRTVLVTLYKPVAPFVEATLVDLAKQAQGLNRHFWVQYRYDSGTPFHSLTGASVPSSEWVTHQGLRYQLRFSAQNTGLFLDMAEARHWLAARATGKKVLNLFAYTCAFSVVAMHHGAQQCTNVDMSKTALNWGRDNHRANQLDCRNVHFLGLNILKSWSRIKKNGPYDVIIIDPPSYQKGSFVAERDYPKVIRRLPELAAPNADILACLNAPEYGTALLLNVFEQAASQAQYQGRLALPSVFKDSDPERQLKLLHYQWVA